MPEHFISTEGWSRDELASLLDDARAFQAKPMQPSLQGKTAALIFFNPSLRTRTSFQVGLAQLGAQSVVLDAGQTWPLEVAEGVVMDGDAEEHVAEAAQVLSRYVDLICIRAFPKFVNWQEEREDPLIMAFAKYATVPIINMETIVHPCQELAMLMALQSAHGHDLTGKKFTLTWTYHPKPLNTAVANSAIIAATKMGMDVTLLCPSEEYLLDDRYINAAKKFSAAAGRGLRVTHDIEDGYGNADAIYAKSWGALPCYGNPGDEKRIRDQFKNFIVDEAKMSLTNNATFSHCLPMRRNIKATDGVIDSERSLIIQEAENRLHAQKAVIVRLMT